MHGRKLSYLIQFLHGYYAAGISSWSEVNLQVHAAHMSYGGRCVIMSMAVRFFNVLRPIAAEGFTSSLIPGAGDELRQCGLNTLQSFPVGFGCGIKQGITIIQF